MTSSGESNAFVRVTPAIMLRLVASLGLALCFAWVGGQLTGGDMWRFMDENGFVFYAGVAAIGGLLITPAIRQQREAQKEK